MRSFCALRIVSFGATRVIWAHGGCKGSVSDPCCSNGGAIGTCPEGQLWSGMQPARWARGLGHCLKIASFR
jgi:hypothetical protein